MKIIDTHQHVFWHGRDDLGLVEDMDEHGIDEAWLLSWEIAPQEDSHLYHRLLNPEHVRPDGTHAGIPLSDLIKCRDRYPDRFVLGYCPHPLKPNAVEHLEAAVRIHGVRVCGEWKFRILFDDPRNLRLMRKAGELKVPVVLHLDIPWLPSDEGNTVYDPLWYGGTVENLERVLKSCPDTVFIGHAPGFWREISADADNASSVYPSGPVKAPGKLLKLLDTYPNLYADLSSGSGLGALKRDPGHARHFIESYSSRLLFGRDYYGSDLAEFINGLGLADSVLRKLYSENALALLGQKA